MEFFKILSLWKRVGERGRILNKKSIDPRRRVR